MKICNVCKQQPVYSFTSTPVGQDKPQRFFKCRCPMHWAEKEDGSLAYSDSSSARPTMRFLVEITK